jgi:hypothetical protein
MALTLRLTEEQELALTELARRQGVSKNEAAARAIEAALERTVHEKQVQSLAQSAIRRYGTVLDRLAQ